MRERRTQKGLSIIGFLLIAAVLVAIAMVGFRVTPAYIEYYSVQKALQRAVDEAKDLNSKQEIQRAFQRYADSGYIESVRGNDVEVSKRGNEITAEVSWTRKLHMVANASIFLEFEATASR
jgi:Domain of unknown function (DUF4845)